LREHIMRAHDARVMPRTSLTTHST
jgi:hypothetical protein